MFKEALVFWLTKHMVDLGIVLVIFILGMIPVLYFSLRSAWREWRCKHEKYFENGRCHAICRDCRKDLGFIQTVRESRYDMRNP